MNDFSAAPSEHEVRITDDNAAYVGKRANEEGITYATQEGGCLVGVLAAKYAATRGKVIGVVGGIEIPPVDSYIAGYEYCAQKAVPGTHIVVQYSNDFVERVGLRGPRAERDQHPGTLRSSSRWPASAVMAL